VFGQKMFVPEEVFFSPTKQFQRAVLRMFEL
jgi:hypothetical protein